MKQRSRKLRDFEVTRVASQAFCKRETVRKYLKQPERMLPATRARVEHAMHELGLLGSSESPIP